MKLVDVPDSKSGGVRPVSVRVRPPAIDKVIRVVLADRRYEFDVERAVFPTVLHRLFDPGSDRAAERGGSEYWTVRIQQRSSSGSEADSFGRRFGAGLFCVEADRGMISRKTPEAL